MLIKAGKMFDLEEIKQKAELARQTTSTSLWEPPAYQCEKCKDMGFTHTLELVTDDPEYTNSKGEPIPYEKARIQNCECKFEKIFAMYNATAGMKPDQQEHTFKTAEIDADNEQHFRTACDFIRDIDKHRELGTWLYIYGDEERANEFNVSAYGTGKTYLLNCIGNALTARRIPALYITEHKLFQDIKDTYNKGSDESESEVLNRYFKIPILLIDDLFTAQYKDWAEDKLFAILDQRKDSKKITIITSNYAPARIKLRLPINGPKIASRIIGESQLIEMIGKDRRMAQAKKKFDKRREWAG